MTFPANIQTRIDALAQANDITAETLIERALDCYEHNPYRDLFNKALEMLCIADTDGYFKQVNPAFTRILGYSEAELLAKPFVEFVHPYDVEATVTAFSQLQDGDPVIQFDNRYRHKDGSYHWLSWTSVPADGMIYATVRDVTDQKHLYDSLEKQTIQMANVFAQMDDAFIQLDSELCFVAMNIHAEHLLRQPFANMRGKRFTEVFPDAEGTPFLAMYRRVIETGKSESRIDYLPEEDRWLEVRAFAIEDGVSIFVRDVTKQHRTERDLKREHDLLNSVMETSVAAITIVSPEGKITFANASATHILGLTQDEINQRTYDAPNWKHTAIDGGPWHDEDQPFVRVMTTGEPVYDVRHAIELPDGEKRYLSINGAPIKDDDGEIINTVFMVTDITDGIQAERAQRESEKRLELALEGGQLGMWDWNIVTGEVVFNERWASMLGYELHEITPHISSWLGLVHPDDTPEVNTVLQAHLDGQTAVYICEHRVRHKDGSWLWIQDQGQVVERDDDGNPLRAVGTHLDITERKQKDAALQESETLYRGLVEHQVDLVCRYKPDGTLVFVNDAYCNFFDLQEDDLIGQSFFDLSPPEQLPKIKARLTELANDPRPRSTITYSKSVDDEARWIEWVDFGITDNEGTLVAVQAVGRDITSLKQTQTALEHSNALLQLLSDVQTYFITEQDPSELFERILDGLLLLTQSEFGFIGRVFYQEDGEPYLKTYAISNIAWDDSSRKFYETHSPNDIAFYNLDTLFGTALKTKKPVIANDPTHDARSGGIPEGHPRLDNFLGLPIIHKTELIGLLGIANRAGGYDKTVINYITPFVTACANIIKAIANDERRQEAEGDLRRNYARLELLTSIDKAMLKAETPEITAQAALFLMEQMEAFDIVNITLFDFDTNEAVTLAGGKFDQKLYRVPLQKVLDWQDALDQGEIRIVKDMAALSEISPAERVWYEQGIRSYALIPMVFNSRANGSLNIGSFQAGGFDYDRLKFAREIADRLAIAIQQHDLYRQTQAYSKELEQRINEMEAINAEMERFTYTVSHDLKSPLITIQGFMGMLERDIAENRADRIQKDVGYIRDAAVKMQELLDDLLELSRIGRLVNPSEHVSITAVTHEALLLLDSQIAERGVRVSVADDLPVIYGDKVRLREVIQNLIENAVKFMGDQPDPYIEIVRHIDNGLYIKDNGIGINSRYHDRVFGLFEQLDPDKEGTGIGLALAKRIVEFHGGEIRVESDGEKHGSTFYITFNQYNEDVQND